MKRSNDRGGGGERNDEQQLPHELIIEILLRLPVKSLIRFKCVCKLCFSLISGPLFATSHFNLITAAPTHRFISITTHSFETRSIDFEASLNDHSATALLNLHFLDTTSYLTLRIGGSCRGFLFLYSFWDFYLWNPSTGIHKQIPLSPIESDEDNVFSMHLYGFGYDPSIDDYLVVLGSTDVSPTANSTHFEFFSLRANTWKEIEGAPYTNAYAIPAVGTLFDGAIHWLTYRVGTSVKVIVAFDLTERTISETPLPNISDLSNVPMDCDLWVSGGLMSLWAMDNDTVEIWVMKEYKVGVCSSWTKTFVLSISIDDDTPYFRPICSTSSGDIVGFDINTGLVKYNANGQLIEHHSCYNQNRSEVALYTESLLSLPLLGDPQQA